MGRRRGKREEVKGCREQCEGDLSQTFPSHTTSSHVPSNYGFLTCCSLGKDWLFAPSNSKVCPCPALDKGLLFLLLAIKEQEKHQGRATSLVQWPPFPISQSLYFSRESFLNCPSTEAAGAALCPLVTPRSVASKIGHRETRLMTTHTGDRFSLPF